MSTPEDFEIREKITLTNPDELYAVSPDADGRELFNHYRHNMTNYDQVLDELRSEQGYVSAWQQKQAAMGAAEKVVELCHREHIKVIKVAQERTSILKGLMQKVGVGTASALTSMLDSWSEKIKTIAKLENSQRQLQVWNDTYRVQRDLVKHLLKQEGISEEVIARVNAIYGTRSTNKAIELGAELLNLEKSEILKLVRSAIRYAKAQSQE